MAGTSLAMTNPRQALLRRVTPLRLAPSRSRAKTREAARLAAGASPPRGRARSGAVMSAFPMENKCSTKARLSPAIFEGLLMASRNKAPHRRQNGAIATRTAGEGGRGPSLLSGKQGKLGNSRNREHFCGNREKFAAEQGNFAPLPRRAAVFRMNPKRDFLASCGARSSFWPSLDNRIGIKRALFGGTAALGRLPFRLEIAYRCKIPPVVK